MSIGLAPVLQPLFDDDFSNDEQLNPSVWRFATPQSSTYGRTQLAPSLPEVSNGAMQLTLQTYDPSAPGTSLYGSVAITNQQFSLGGTGTGIAFSVVAAVPDPSPGMIGGMFGYWQDPITDLYSGFETDIVTNNANLPGNPLSTSLYNNQEEGTVAPIQVPDPDGITTYQTYTMEWFPNAVLWFVDGTLVNETTVNVPQAPMQFYLDFWAPDTTWASAYNFGLQPTANPLLNQTYNFEVQSVSINEVENNTLSPPYGGSGAATILWQNEDGQMAAWMINATGTAPDGGGAYPVNPGNTWHIVATGTYVGDPDLTIIWQNASSQVDVWLMNATDTGPIGGGGLSAFPGAGWNIVGTGDFNGDGNTDLLWQNGNGTVVLWLMQEDGFVPISGSTLGTAGPGWQVVGTGDFTDGGGGAIFWQAPNGSIEVWQVNAAGSAVTSATPVASDPGLGWRVVGTGDFNDDGNTDLVLQNQDGSLAVWLMNAGGTATIGGGIIGNPGPGYQVVGTQDLNGAGPSDILLQNQNGLVTAWYLDPSGTTFVASSVIGANPGAAWHVTGGSNMWFIDSGAGGETLAATPTMPDDFTFDNAAAGLHTVTGFRTFEDTIELNGTQFGSFAAIEAATTETPGGAMINLGNGATLLVAGLSPYNLQPSNFALT